MTILNFSLISNVSAVVVFLIFTVLLLINWRGQLIGVLFILCSLFSALFFVSISFNTGFGAIPVAYIRLLEVLRDSLWLILLFQIVRLQLDHQGGALRRNILFPGILAILILCMGSVIGVIYEIIDLNVPNFIGIDLLYYGFFFYSIAGLVLVEQVYRKTSSDYRWTTKYLCIGLGGIFAYDFYLYSDAVLFKQMNPDLWYARGAVNAVCVPFLIVSVRRIREWKMELFISRQVVFQSSMLIAAGVYLSFIAIAGYYVRVFGGSWGGALQTVFLFAAIMVFLALIFSSDIRARISVYLVKHFYENKYDYREQWLGFTRLLAESKSGEGIYINIVKAFADTMKCTSGALWLLDEGRDYRCKAEVYLKEVTTLEIKKDDALVNFLQDQQWVINISEHVENNNGKNIELPDWLMSIDKARLLIPLLNEDVLIGFILLVRSDINKTYNWEDYDLLKTMGQQTAGYLELINVTERLAESRQFEAFNRLSAFVVHDIKNLVAQLSLVSTNAKRFRDNPDFINDAFDTIENSVDKMNRLLRNLRKDAIPGQTERKQIDLSTLIVEVANLTTQQKPCPSVTVTENNLFIKADKDKITTVLQHLIQNAQEASDEDGKLELALIRQDNYVEIRIIDNGCGMDDNFIKTRLFKPFDTTKGNAGMGIGVYESREIIRSLGGRLEVESFPGKGTEFIITLPLSCSENIIQEGLVGDE